MPSLSKAPSIAIDKIKIGDRFRKEYKDIEGLAKSIAEKGLLHPIVIDSDCNLIAGGRRIRAVVQELGWTEIPYNLVDITTPLGRRQAELVENVDREDMTWQEEVNLKREIDRLQKEIEGEGAGFGGGRPNAEGWGIRKTAELLGESHANTSRDVTLAEAMEQIPELAECGSKHEALKKFNQLAEVLAVQELQKRAAESVVKTDEEQIAVNAADWYVIGNALDGMDEMSLEQMTGAHYNFVLAEVDPPYGILLHDLRQGKMDDTYQEVDAIEYGKFVAGIAAHVFELLNANAWCVWWFGQSHIRTVYDILTEVGFKVDEVPAVWVKPQGQTNQPEKYFARAWEGFFLCRKGNPVMHRRGRLNVFQYPGVAHQKRIHPTERPLDLMLDIIQTLCPPASGNILVPFLGSGNTLRAALFNGMRGKGWDIAGDKTKALFTARLLEDYKKIKESISGQESTEETDGEGDVPF